MKIGDVRCVHSCSSGTVPAPSLASLQIRFKEIMEVSSPRTEASAIDPSSKLFCCRSVRRCIPLVYRQELYHILCLTGPMVASHILNHLLPFVITIFCGRLGNSVLAGYGMASATINITAATGGGLALAADTLISQTFGGKNLRRVGIILQRSVLILLIFCLPCWGVLINTQPLLLLLGQDPEVARIAQLYVVCYLPAVPALFLHQLQVAYLQNQGVILPQMYAAIAANIANVVTNYILLNWLNLGLYGSAAANTICQIYICVFLYLYIRWKKLHVETWGGWSCDSLQEWDGYMKLAIPSSLMLCFDWWIYEIGGFLAGMLGEMNLAALHAVNMLALTSYVIPLGFNGAACVRVGNALGAGDTAGAILTSKVSLTCAAAFAVLQGLVLASTKTVIGFLFTSDRHIVALVSKLLNVYCVHQLFDGLVCVSMGILLGSGKQKIAALVNFLGYYCIGLPLGASLMFAAKLDLIGFMLGLLVSVCVQSSIFIAVILKLNWEQVTKEAVERAGKRKIPAMSTPDSLTARHRENGDEYMSMNSNDQNEETDVEEKPPVLLSTAHLILRRGLTTLAALLILAAGIAVHLTVPLPEVSYAVKANTTLDLNVTTPSSLIHSTTVSM
ncbi:multidrug and toxin extrusion protein 1-like isoform X1 [Carassius auratus]|uniref:Multidrug and toxin extrusion protein n=2 Tax=Carassius auratus TaxID=7957 RepID=A0A6P6QX40_CARAU|nr:multidrug and toxin extrusion protein 1-like isoform X1 [Carassius auratus]XP_026137752.1 multidrug and toxin extrusion protein 1-like isoform X1 [Carassius auratus]